MIQPRAVLYQIEPKKWSTNKSLIKHHKQIDTIFNYRAQMLLGTEYHKKLLYDISHGRLVGWYLSASVNQSPKVFELDTI